MKPHIHTASWLGLLLLISTTFLGHAAPLHARRAPQLATHKQAKGHNTQPPDKPKTQLRCAVTLDGGDGSSVMWDLRHAFHRGSLHVVRPVEPSCGGYSDRDYFVRARTSDFLVLKQINDQDEFKSVAKLFADKPPKTILDLGSNAGFAAAQFAARWPAASILAVEPSKMNHAMTVLNTQHNRNVRAVWGGVWPAPGLLRISNTLTNKGLGFAEWGFVVEELNSRSLPNSPADQVIPAFTVDELMQSMGWSSIDYMKVAIECGEFHLLGVGNATQSPKLAAADEPDDNDDSDGDDAAAAPPAAVVEPPAWLQRVGCLTMELHSWCGKDREAVKRVLVAAGMEFKGEAGELLIYCGPAAGGDAGSGAAATGTATAG